MNDFIFHTERGAPDKPVWLLLHGTGGDEHDLVPLAKQIAPDWGILSPRGQVNENGQNRYFRRLADGVFDLEDMAQRSQDLTNFIAQKKTSRKLIALGYSNGANMIASLLLRGMSNIDGAVLLRPTLPFVPDILPKIELPVLILTGSLDQVTLAQYGEELGTLLTKAGANVSYQVRLTTHGLNDQDVVRTRDWLKMIGE